MSTEDDELEAAIQFPKAAMAMVELVRKCYWPLGQFAKLEAERLRHQTRANQEAVRACEAEAERDKLAAALRELLLGISIHNDRITPGMLAAKIEGPVVDAVRAALAPAGNGEGGE